MRPRRLVSLLLATLAFWVLASLVAGWLLTGQLVLAGLGGGAPGPVEIAGPLNNGR